jgi:YD repeat-containing protein
MNHMQLRRAYSIGALRGSIWSLVLRWFAKSLRPISSLLLLGSPCFGVDSGFGFGVTTFSGVPVTYFGTDPSGHTYMLVGFGHITNGTIQFEIQEGAGPCSGKMFGTPGSPRGVYSVWALNVFPPVEGTAPAQQYWFGNGEQGFLDLGIVASGATTPTYSIYYNPSPTPPSSTSCTRPAGGAAGNAAPAPNLPVDGPSAGPDGVQPNGDLEVAATDVSNEGMNGWGQTRSYSSALGTALGSSNGTGWFVAQRPSILDAANNSQVVVATAPNHMITFNISGSTYTPIQESTETLSHSGTLYTFTDSNGNVTTFNDGTVTPGAEAGQMVLYTDKAGNVTTPVYDTNGILTSTTSATTVAGTSYKNTYTYNYNSSGLVSSVVFSQQIGAGTPLIIRQVAYTYYTTT